MARVFSFDVFDTCVTRIYATPEDLFLEMAYRYLRSASTTFDDNLVRSLARERIEAERIAGEKSNNEEISLSEIHAELVQISTLTIDKEKLASLEEAIELESCLPVSTVLQQVKTLQKSGARVIFISDMYLPACTVRAILRKCGFDLQDNDLYLSSEVGLKKRTGKLFRHVLAEEKISAIDLEHLGDHKRNDVSVPRSLGIHARLYAEDSTEHPDNDQYLYRRSLIPRITHRLRSSSRLLRKTLRGPLEHLYFQRQLALSRLMASSDWLYKNRSIRPIEHEQELSLIGYHVAAPLFTAYVYWLLLDAQKRGIRRLYFISRNGQIFLRIAERICTQQKMDIDCRYLYGSRAAWYAGSMTTYNESSINLLLEKHPDRSAVQILKVLGLKSSEIATLLDCLEPQDREQALDPDARSIRYILNCFTAASPRKIIEQRFAQAWQDVVDYFKQEKVFEEGRFGTVDIGWRLSSHNAFHQIIKRAGGNGFTGYYFGVTRTHQPVEQSAPFHAFINDIETRRNSWIFKLGAMSILEESFSAADHATTTGYHREGANILPTLSGDTRTVYRASSDAIQEAILAFCDFYLSEDLLSDLEYARKDILEQYERMYKYPTKYEAQALADTPVHALTSHAASQQRTLAHPITLGQLCNTIYLMISSGRQFDARWVWFQGSLAISHFFVATAGRLLSFLESVLRRIWS